jgi:two-component system sensor histidine kinase QseC
MHETTCPPEPARPPDAAVFLLTSAAWGIASVIAWQQTSKKLDKLFDTQQLLFARRLSAMNFDELRARPVLGKEKGQTRPHRRRRAGVRHFHPRRQNGASRRREWSGHPVAKSRRGFSDGYLNNDDDEWRFLWLTTGDGRYRIVVGQEWDYRREMALDIVTSQLTPWMVALPLMFVLLIVLLSRELAPLKKLAQHAAPARAGLSGIAQRRQDAQRSPPAGRCPESAVCPDA